MRIVWLLIGAVALDLIIGDPAWIPHPIRGIGWLIAKGRSCCAPFFPQGCGWREKSWRWVCR